MTKRLARFYHIGGVVLACGCAASAPDGSYLQGAEEADLPVATISQKLTSSGNTTFVPNGTIAVCFQAVDITWDANPANVTGTVGNASSPAYVSFKTLVQTSVEAAYENIANAKLDFTGWADCSDSVSGSFSGNIRVVVQTNNPVGNFSTRHCTRSPTNLPISHDVDPECINTLAWSNDREITIYTNPTYYGATTVGAVLHEFGHALGFDHEFARPDSNQSPSAYGSCTAQAAGTTIGGMTLYDPQSIMNSTYCNLNDDLSQLDRLGLAISYPASLSAPPLVAFSFLRGDGSFLTFSNTSVAQGWLEQGATTSAYTQLPSWTIDGTSIASSQTPVAVSSLGWHVVQGSFTDFVGRARTIKPTLVEVNPSAAAALMLSFM